MIIYLIKNNINNKKYVGQTIQDINLRFKRHCDKSKSNMSMPICKAIQKYGKENFSIKILCFCNSLELLNEMEKYYCYLLKTFSPNGYNLKAGNGKGALSQELKNKISLGNKNKIISLETKYKLSESHKGYKVSQATKDKLSKINKGKRGSDLCYQRSIEASSKEYDMISPNGEIIHIKNMAEFCKNNKLSKNKMCSVNTGKLKTYKGWKKLVKNAK